MRLHVKKRTVAAAAVAVNLNQMRLVSQTRAPHGPAMHEVKDTRRNFLVVAVFSAIIVLFGLANFVH